jgi:hypothetical protein
MTKDKDRTPVARDIIAMCTKCKMELNHIVVAQDINGFVERIKCHTCGSEHKYRSTRKTSSSAGVRKKTSVRKVDPEKDFKRLTERSSGKSSVPYNMSGSYNKDDVIDHGIFGRGIVINTSSQKMEVVFADGLRTLAMDRKST